MSRNVANMTSPIDIITTMSNGNPGAISVLTDIYRSSEIVTLSMVSMWLDEAGIYGCDIWVGYKDHCKCNIDTFIDLVSSADSELLETINSERSMMGNNPVSWNHSA